MPQVSKKKQVVFPRKYDFQRWWFLFYVLINYLFFPFERAVTEPSVSLRTEVTRVGVHFIPVVVPQLGITRAFKNMI